MGLISSQGGIDHYVWRGMFRLAGAIEGICFEVAGLDLCFEDSVWWGVVGQLTPKELCLS